MYEYIIYGAQMLFQGCLFRFGESKIPIFASLFEYFSDKYLPTAVSDKNAYKLYT